MAATYNPTTAASDLNKLYRKVQGTLLEGMNFHSEEYDMLGDLEDYRIDWSAREITVPIDLNEGAGVASIPEGGFEAMPSSPSVEEITLSWILLNKRFTATLTSRYIDQRSRGAMLRRQIVHQGKKAVQAIASSVSDYFYGFSTGVLALAGTGQASASSHDIDLIDGYGQAGIDSAPFLVDKFKVGDRVALVQAGALVTNAIGTVTARDKATGEISVTWAGAVVITQGDQIVKANSQEDTTLAGGTDYNRGLVGLLEMMTSASVHNLTHDNWQAAVEETTSTTFATEDLQYLAQEINDQGGGKLGRLLMSPGVKRAIISATANNLRFTDPFNLQLDADIKAGGVKITTTRRVPPKHIFGYDPKSIKKMVLLKKPTEGDAPMWEDGVKIPDRSALVFSIDFPMQMVVLNRRNLGYYNNVTEA